MMFNNPVDIAHFAVGIVTGFAVLMLFALLLAAMSGGGATHTHSVSVPRNDDVADVPGAVYVLTQLSNDLWEAENWDAEEQVNNALELLGIDVEDE